MWATLALVGSGAILFGAMVYLVILEARRRATAETEARHNRAALESRERVDEILSESVGRRWDLVAHLKNANRAKRSEKR